MMRKRNMKLNEEIFEEYIFIILFLLICFFSRSNNNFKILRNRR
jgi:hypothetical protein